MVRYIRLIFSGYNSGTFVGFFDVSVFQVFLCILLYFSYFNLYPLPIWILDWLLNILCSAKALLENLLLSWLHIFHSLDYVVDIQMHQSECYILLFINLFFNFSPWFYLRKWNNNSLLRPQWKLYLFKISLRNIYFYWCHLTEVSI